ncbi:hypothetical protein K440DRAFT_205776 [Wilcoxina mikolae CBS 423.85]|nr:hypothetical protein K440DRAFT_205776 [Wilcoxina mikolae CBS 423.85]
MPLVRGSNDDDDDSGSNPPAKSGTVRRVRPSPELVALGRGVFPSSRQQIHQKDTETSPDGQLAPPGTVRINGEIVPGMEPGPTELIGTVREVSGHGFPSTPQNRGKYYHPTLGRWMSFPAERPTEEPVGPVVETEQPVVRKRDKVRGVMLRCASLIHKKKEKPPAEKINISFPHDFRKLG